MLSVIDIDFDTDEIERRRLLVRDLWAGRPVDHIPVMITNRSVSLRNMVRCLLKM